MKAALLAVLLASCVVGCMRVPERDLNLVRPWKVATVLAVGDAGSFGPMTAGDCRGALPAVDHESKRFARVRYTSGRHFHFRIVPVPADLAVDEGDTVEVRSGGCDDVLRRRP